MAAVEHDVTAGGGGQRVGGDQGQCVVGCREALLPDLHGVGRPPHGELRQEFANPAVAAGIAEQHEMPVAEVFGGHVGVVLDRERAAIVKPPLPGEPPQVRLGPAADRLMGGLAGAADAEKRRREGVVDRPLEARSLAGERRAREVSKAPPAVALPGEGERPRGVAGPRRQGHGLASDRQGRFRPARGRDRQGRRMNREPGDVGELRHGHRAVRREGGVDLGPLVMGVEAEQLHPVAAAELQRPGDEPDPRRAGGNAGAPSAAIAFSIWPWEGKYGSC